MQELGSDHYRGCSVSFLTEEPNVILHVDFEQAAGQTEYHKAAARADRLAREAFSHLQELGYTQVKKEEGSRDGEPTLDVVLSPPANPAKNSFEMRMDFESAMVSTKQALAEEREVRKELREQNNHPNALKKVLLKPLQKAGIAPNLAEQIVREQVSAIESALNIRPRGHTP